MSFSVGGAEGYMTAGSYPDDGLGEVFLKLGKQDSTLAGVMDAFSIAISIALQYGVPLEAYESKFVNWYNFEPAGLTDDPDIRMAQSIMATSSSPRAGLPALREARRARHLHRRRACRAGLRRLRLDPPGPGRGDRRRRWRSPSRPSRQSAPVESPVTPAEVAVAGEAPAPKAAHSSAAAPDHHRQVVGRTAVHDLRIRCVPPGSCYSSPEGCGSTSGCS